MFTAYNKHIIGLAFIMLLSSGKLEPAGIIKYYYLIKNYWSLIATHLVLILGVIVVVGTASSKSLGLVASDRIGMKCGRNVLHANTHRLTAFRFDDIFSRWRPRRHFTQKSAATGWVEASAWSAYAAAYASSWSIAHSYFLLLSLCYYAAQIYCYLTLRHRLLYLASFETVL